MTVNEKEQVMKDKENVLSKGKDRARIKYLRKKEKEKKEEKKKRKKKKERKKEREERKKENTKHDPNT